MKGDKNRGDTVESPLWRGVSGAERGIERGCFSVVGLWRQDIYPKFMCVAFSEKCPKAEKRSGVWGLS